MEYQHILLQQSDGIATLTLNRPEVLNAYNPEMGDEIVDAFARIRADDEMRVFDAENFISIPWDESYPGRRVSK